MPSRNRKKQGDRGAAQRPSEAESHGGADTNGGPDLDSQDSPALDDARPWMPLASSEHRPDTAYVGNVPRTFVDEMLGNSLWARGLDPPIRAAIASAISTQCVRWHIEYAEFRDHVNAYLTRMDRHRRHRRDVLTNIDNYMSLLTAKFNILQDTVHRLHDEILKMHHAKTLYTRVISIEAEIVILKTRVDELEGGISGRLKRAQRKAVLSRSPSRTIAYPSSVADGSQPTMPSAYDVDDDAALQVYVAELPRDSFATIPHSPFKSLSCEGSYHD